MLRYRLSARASSSRVSTAALSGDTRSARVKARHRFFHYTIQRMCRRILVLNYGLLSHSKQTERVAFALTNTNSFYNLLHRMCRSIIIILAFY